MTTLHGAPLPKDFEDNAPLPAAEFNAVKNYWVTDELPDTAEDGDVVFVIESDPVGDGLPGIGGWAKVQSVSGVVEEKTFNDGDITWKVYKFTDDGFVTCSEAGLVEVLAVGSGGAGTGSGNHRLGGGGGGVIQQLTKLEAIPNPVVVGKGENQNAGQCSYVGDALAVFGGYGGASSGASSGAYDLARPPYVRVVPGQGHFGHAVGSGGGGGADGPGTSTEGGPGRVINFDGDGDVEYGRGGEPEYKSVQAPGIGQGGYAWAGGAGGPYEGGDGILMVRVPEQNAARVVMNVHGWNNYASVENGVVTSVNKVPDNVPYTTAVDEIPCGPEVTEGWNYDGSEFVAPEPDYSEQIKELEETLKNLRSAK